METITNFIKMEEEPLVTPLFRDQDRIILEKVNPRNKNTAKYIIASYGISHPLNEIFKKYYNDPKGMRQELLKFSSEREKYLLEATKDL